MSSPREFQLGAGGLIVTVLLHAGLVAVALSNIGGDGTADAASHRFDDAVTIEASLAFKQVEDQVQPQKQRKKTYAPPVEEVAPVETPPTPPEQKIDTDTVAQPEEPEAAKVKPKHKIKPKKDEIDPNSIFDKNRVQDDDASTTGVDEVPKEGSADGSDWGTERDARGHPYAAELKGRLYSAWAVPSLEAGAGEPEGCVKLDIFGKIVDRTMKKKSGNANIDRSVELALKNAPDMEEPVPDDILNLMTVKGICYRFKKKADQ